VEILIEEGIADAANLRETFPTGVSLPLLDILYRCRNSEDISLSQQGWSLVGREDLSRNLDNEEITAPEPPLPEKVSVQSNAEQQDGTEEGKDDDFGDKDNDGLVPLELRSSMLFSGDNRVREAARLVRSSRSIFLKVPRSVEVTDHEFEQLKQKGLALLVQRTLALPIGRGMMTIGGLQPVAAEPLPIPDLCLKGRVPPANASLSLDQTECPAETRIWPEFHNGVAAGLRLPLPGECKETMSRVTRSWIVYNRPLPANQEGNEEANRAAELKQHAHGGFLLALGLRGHLIALEMTDLYEYLTEGTVTTTVGVILGMAANKRGTCDMAISTMLFLHVPSLIPQHFSAIDVASSVQSAAVTGAGLLFQGSSHRMMTEFLLNEIGKRPESDMSAFDREAYTLACGISLGMVNLCVGNSVKAAGIADLRIEERLRRYIEGGEANEDEHRRVRETNDRFSVPLAANGSDNEKCSIVHEGNFINTDLTSPAATMALSFMYMKTGNKTIAATVELPSTHFLLEWVRPDFLGLRVLAKSLILWDDVKASKEWVEDQIPKVVRTAYAEMRERAKRMSLGLAVKGRHTYEYDRKALRQMYVHVLTGACFSIGVRFAGSGDESAKNVLFEYVTMLYKLKEANDPVSVASKPEFPILESCLGQAAMALALVLAGTGDLDALKLFKILRWRHDYDIRFGNHMTYGMAIGLLFLGGGTMTLGRKPDQIAAIVTAFFPRFPMQTGDNQYHLQALRHLYALAVEKREVCAVDVDSGSSIHVPVQFKGIHSGLVESTNVPYLRRNTDSPKSLLTALSDEFYPVTIDLDKINGMTFFVKKRSYVGRDVLSKYDDAPLSKLVKSSTTSPFFLSFAEYFDRVKQADPFLRGHVFDSIARDAEEGLLLYMALSRDFSAKRQSMPSHSFLWDLRLMRSYFAHQRPSKSLLSGELVALFLDRAERILVDQTTQNPEHLRRAQILYDH
jgi:anaphase-promoting complex subunit 1